MLLRLLALFLLTYQYQYSIMEWIQQKTSKPAELKLKCCNFFRRLEEERKKREAKDQRDREEAQAGRTCPLLPENGRC